MSVARISGLPAGQRGIALLAAILIVAIATVLAASIAFENAMTARRGAATLAFDEGVLVAEAAEALAAYALREDARHSRELDHPAEAWAQPLGPVEIMPGIVLDARLEDLQGRFNLNSLVAPGPDGRMQVDQEAVLALQRLMGMLEIEPKWAQLIADWIDPDVAPEFPDGAEDNVYTGEDPPYRTPNLLITSTTELLALPEFGRERFRKLAPYVTALPQDAQINVCTASGYVLDALIPGGHEEFSVDPERLAEARENGCFPRMSEYRAAFGSDPQAFERIEEKLSERSKYFRLTSIVTIGTAEFALYSLLQREPTGQVRPILRSYVAD